MELATATTAIAAKNTVVLRLMLAIPSLSIICLPWLSRALC
jgi:hypothetical protein